MTSVRYYTFTFSDADGSLGEGGIAATYFSPLGDELRAAEYKIPVIFEPAKYQVEASSFKDALVYRAPVEISHDGAVTRFFYLTNISGGQRLREGKYLFYLEGTDLPGCYVNEPHRGGIYSNDSADRVIAEALGMNLVTETSDVRYWQDANSYYRPVATDIKLSSMRITGWLPYTEHARDNLRTILQAINGRLSTWTVGQTEFVPGVSAGDVVDYFTIDPDATQTEISPYRTYMGDAYEDQENVAQVTVNEHAYLALDTTPAETLYRETGAATRKLVVFDKPCHSLDGGGLTINSSGANFAIVTGTGTLTGKPYVDTVRRLSQTIQGTGGRGETRLVDNTLSNSLNSQALLDRAVNYYQNARTLRSDFVAPDAISAGRPVELEDPLGDTVGAYIAEQTMTFSGINKASNRLAAGWYPISGGLYTRVDVLAGSGTWTPPEGATRLKFVLIQGGKGGWGGYQGAPKTSTAPTAGGAVGEGGNGGKVREVVIEEADIAASYTYTAGAAGSPGAANHGEGGSGGHSTVTDGSTTWSSASGESLPNGYQNPINGRVYATPGRDGYYAGGDGWGSSVSPRPAISDTETAVSEVTTWMSGNRRSYSSYPDAYGGGPAYGSRGGDPEGGGYAGSGANAVLDGFGGYVVIAPEYGCGGIGGNGGGGAGEGRYSQYYAFPGSGSPGGPAGAGVILAFVAFGSAPPTPVDTSLLDAHGEPLYDAYYERLRAREE